MMKRVKHKGMTLVELIIALGIMGVLAVMIMTMISTSSNTYGSVSTETQLQAEAELAASAITELIIDAKEAPINSLSGTSYEDQITAFNDSEKNFDVSSTDSFLVLLSDNNGIENTFIIARNTLKNELYLIKDGADPELLADHIAGFTTNRTRYDADNVISFNIDYEKKDKKYAGDYQVYMRNRALSDHVEPGSRRNPRMSRIIMTPKVYYVDIKGLNNNVHVAAVHEDSMSNTKSDNNLVFTASVESSGFDMVEGKFTDNLAASANSNMFSSVNKDILAKYVAKNAAEFPSGTDLTGPGAPWTAASTTDAAPHNFQITFNLKDTNDPIDPLVRATSEDPIEIEAAFEGTTYAIWRPATAEDAAEAGAVIEDGLYREQDEKRSDPNKTVNKSEIRFNQITFRDLTLISTKGSSTWLSKYDEYGKEPLVHCDYFLETKGNVLMVIDKRKLNLASEDADWSLYYKEADDLSGDWMPAPRSMAYFTSNDVNPSHTLQLGDSAGNGFVLKVEAKSRFDDSQKVEKVFGIFPLETPIDKNGMYSRGYFTDMRAVANNNTPLNPAWVVTGSNGNGETKTSVAGEITNLYYLDVTMSNGTDSGIRPGRFKEEVGPPRTVRMYYDYSSYGYGADKLIEFYSNPGNAHLTAAFMDKNNDVYLTFGENNALTNDQKLNILQTVHDRSGVPIKQIYIYGSVNVVEEGVTKTYGQMIGNALKYTLEKTKVTKKPPYDTEYIVLQKAGSADVEAVTNYYNIISPRNGNYYFGAYLAPDGDANIAYLDDNLLEGTKGASNQYFNVAYTGQYGDTNKYVDVGKVTLTAKSTTMQKNYPTDPTTFRLAAEQYYGLRSAKKWKESGIPSGADPYIEYKVLIVNVESSNAYIPGPEAKTTDANLKWPNPTGSTQVTVKGRDINGTAVEGKVYKSGTKYKLVYNGKTYTYNATYDYWAK